MSLSWRKKQKVIGKPITPKCQLKWDTFYEKQLSGNQFGIHVYWTRLNVNKALSSSNGNVCISLSTQNIYYKKWENQMVNTFVNVIYVKMK
jgi:hypothetical protein